MTGYRRLTILAIAALLAAGCGATTPTAPGPSLAPASFSASVGPSPTYRLIQTYPPTEPPPPGTPEPTRDPCPTQVPADQPGIRLFGPLDRVSPGVAITRMARVSDPSAELPLPELDRPDASMSFVGGRRSSLDLFYVDFDWPWGWNITSLSATLTIGDRDPITLDVELRSDSLGNVSGASVRIPDRDTTATLDVRLAWYDTCFAYEGTVTAPVRIYPEASVADCPTGRVAAFDELGSAFDPPTLVNGTAVDLIPFGFAGKVRDMAVIDPLPPYVGFDVETPTLGAAPGATITVVPGNPAVELRLADRRRAAFYERAPLLRWLDGGWIHGDEPEALIVFRSKLVANDDGTFTFTAATEPGRYAAEVTFEYDAACTLGSAGFVIGVDVP